MAYAFTEQEQAQIRLVYESIKVDGSEVRWWALYEEVSSLLKVALENGAVESADIKATEAAVLWFDGAVLVNKGEGAFSTFIREYTARQFELRFGSSSMAAVITQMQAVSDAIAEQVVQNDILARGGELPSMQALASSDASIAGQRLFSSLGQDDSAVSDNSGWSGAILFSMFGTDESGRLLSGGTAGALDTLQDLRDVLFAIDSFYTAFSAAFVGTVSGLVGLPPTTILAVRQIIIDIPIFGRAVEGKGGLDEFSSNVLSELQAGNGFTEATLKAGGGKN